jgi:hypothetical protein
MGGIREMTDMTDDDMLLVAQQLAGFEPIPEPTPGLDKDK